MVRGCLQWFQHAGRKTTSCRSDLMHCCCEASIMHGIMPEAFGNLRKASPTKCILKRRLCDCDCGALLCPTSTPPSHQADLTGDKVHGFDVYRTDTNAITECRARSVTATTAARATKRVRSHGRKEHRARLPTSSTQTVEPIATNPLRGRPNTPQGRE